jgi:diguanylate cyclase (GGDEF)-like protein/PAS domain S-box-containing protein
MVGAERTTLEIVLAISAVVAAILSFKGMRSKWRLEEVRIHYRSATESASEGFYMGVPVKGLDGSIVDFRLVDCNQRAAAMVGLSKEVMIGRLISELYPGEDMKRVMPVMVEAMRSGFYEDETPVPDGSILKPRWLHRKIVAWRGGIAITLRDITQQKDYEQELTRLATSDFLTGLPNRLWLTQYLPDAIERAAHGDTLLAVLFLDLDDFKDLNDLLGHTAGDEILKTVANTIRGALPDQHKVIRLGGDEFTIVLESVRDQEAVLQIVTHILNAFAEPLDVAQRRITVRMSIGVATCPAHGSDMETLLRCADIAMYAAKADNQCRYRFFSPELFAAMKSRMDLVDRLSNAIQEDQFVIHYQPRVATATGEIVSMEALVRWEHPERGMIPPNDFIPLAESTGLIIGLGDLVMRKVCGQIGAWQSNGVPVVPVSVNVSARQFNDIDMKQLIVDCLDHHQIDPGLLEIELTESAMMGEGEEVLFALRAIKAMGVRMHIDDFGTGYSSLALLHRLDMDGLKVDREFTNQLGRNDEGEVFFSAIVSMAHSLGMRVIAEGVETAEQVAHLQRLECEEIQGFFVSRPLPAADIPAVLSRRFLYPDAKAAA